MTRTEMHALIAEKLMGWKYVGFRYESFNPAKSSFTGPWLLSPKECEKSGYVDVDWASDSKSDVEGVEMHCHVPDFSSSLDLCRQAEQEIAKNHYLMLAYDRALESEVLELNHPPETLIRFSMTTAPADLRVKAMARVLQRLKGMVRVTWNDRTEQ